MLVYDKAGLTIYCDNTLTTNHIAESSIDLIVTSPPYNVGIPYKDHKDSMPYKEYLGFTERYLKRLRRWSKIDGRLCLNVPIDSWDESHRPIPVASDVLQIAKKVGWKYRSTILWIKHRTIGKRLLGTFADARSPVVIPNAEVILVLYKGRWGKILYKKKRSGISKKDYNDWIQGVWYIQPEIPSRVGHPAPYPVELARRCILLFSYEGERVLDPFLGSGSTLIACFQTRRRGLGIEISKEYCDLAIKRLSSIVSARIGS